MFTYPTVQKGRKTQEPKYLETVVGAVCKHMTITNENGLRRADQGPWEPQAPTGPPSRHREM